MNSHQDRATCPVPFHQITRRRKRPQSPLPLQNGQNDTHIPKRAEPGPNRHGRGEGNSMYDMKEDGP
ncbi:hypothetical protein TorRG33x02_051560 [Trema orientale]|uniref:Uncharacterized protein n=1 Tax=Trema orientale TaxID=63057 RepID=A0A2P5FMC0_TREOI|nr:hypothetical protein TorRG33x02_051560 [Trema orientale]